MEEVLNKNLSDLSITITFIDGVIILILSTLAGLIVRYFFCKYAESMSSKKAFGNTILLVTVCVASLIAVVKSSLALSLGLVGALSVVRFRTAVKEPYNLSFILLAICAGIAIGASQYLFGFLICLFGCLITFLISKNIKQINNRGNVDDLDSISIRLPSSSNIDLLYSILGRYSSEFNIRTFSDSQEGFIDLTLRASIQNISNLESLRKDLKNNFKNVDFAFYETPGN